MSRMRNMIVAIALSGAATSLMASGPYEATIRRNAGIGLGTTIWGGVGDGLICQVSAATTNGSCGNQTFAISTGTLGAEKASKVAKSELTGYLHDNMDTTARAIASGRGESMDAICDIMAVPAEQRAQVASRLQANFSTIYSSGAVTHDVVAERILAVMTAA